MLRVSAGATNSFSDLATAIEKPNRGQYRKNIPGRNEFTDFEQFGVEHPPRIKSILAIHSANYPGNGITLRQNRSTSHITLRCNHSTNHVNESAVRRKALKSRQRTILVDSEA